MDVGPWRSDRHATLPAAAGTPDDPAMSRLFRFLSKCRSIVPRCSKDALYEPKSEMPALAPGRRNAGRRRHPSIKIADVTSD